MPLTPAFKLAGTAVGSTTTATVSWPTHATNDVALLLVETNNEASTLVTNTVFTIIGTAQGTGTAAAVSAVAIQAYWGRATSAAMGPVTCADAGDHVYARILTFSNCVTSGNPYDVTFGGVKATSATNLTVTSAATTTIPNALVVVNVAGGNDSAAAQATNWANSNLASITEHADAGTVSGNGGSLSEADGVLAFAGAIGDTTLAQATNTTWKNAYIVVALKGAAAALAMTVAAAGVGNASASFSANRNVTVAVAGVGAASATFGAKRPFSASAAGAATTSIREQRWRPWTAGLPAGIASTSITLEAKRGFTVAPAGLSTATATIGKVAPPTTISVLSQGVGGTSVLFGALHPVSVTSAGLGTATVDLTAIIGPPAPVVTTTPGGDTRKPISRFEQPTWPHRGKTRYVDGKPVQEVEVLAEPTPAPTPVPVQVPPTPAVPSAPPSRIVAPPVPPIPPAVPAPIPEPDILRWLRPVPPAPTIQILTLPPVPATKCIWVTRYWGGLGLALLAQRQGADVLVATDYRTVKADELASTKRIGDGLLRKIDLQQAMRQLRGQGHLWVFDSNDLPTEADQLRRQGEAVIGTSRLSAKMEDDREFAGQVAQSVGFPLPETQEFHDYSQAVKFLQANADRAFCYKPDKQDPTATYVPLEADGPKANAELQEYLNALEGGHRPSFVLQEVVHGIEVNVDLWLSHGQPIAAFMDLEAKRKLVGELGENVGCAGDYVLPLPLDHPAVAATVGRYLNWPALRDYTGTIDANVMLVQGQPYFLENCFRFGYNAYAALFQALADVPMVELLRRWISGESVTEGFSGVAASLTLVVDHPKAGTPILIPPAQREATYLYRSYGEGALRLVEDWPEVACVVAKDTTLAGAGERCLEHARQIGLPGKGYRIDLTSDRQDTLPLARFQALQEMGWFPETNDDEDVILALMEVL